MCLLNTTNADIALTLANVTEALQELAVNGDSPMAFLHEATIDIEQGRRGAEWQVDLGSMGRLVRQWTRDRAQREAAIEVRQAFIDADEELLPAIATVPVCPICQNRRVVIVAVDEWGEDITNPCPACVHDDHDLRRFA